jgi:predicted DCC family thiol-disulfide oxidoreductase YuxK
MAVTRRADVRAWLEHEMGWRAAPRGSRLPRPWTDRYSNVLGAALVRATP